MNNSNIKYWLIFASVVIIAALVFYIFHSCNDNNKPPEPVKPNDSSQTITEVPQPVIIIKDAPAVIKWRTKYKYVEINKFITIVDTFKQHDTVFFKTMAFTACLDTVIEKDTIMTEFNFPEMNFNEMIKRHPDIIKENTIKIYVPVPNTFKQDATIFGYGAGTSAILLTGLYILIHK